MQYSVWKCTTLRVLILFIYWLFHDAVTSSDYIVSVDYEWWIRKDMEESIFGLINVLWKDWGKTLGSLSQFSLSAGKDLNPVAKQEC
jgi:hypothetical protein